MAGKGKQGIGSPEVRRNEATGGYELGATIDGEFVAFAKRDGEETDFRVAQLAGADSAPEPEPATPA